MECVFCKIAAGQSGADIIYEDQDVVAFRDINPVAPHHVLIIPRRHIATVNDLKPEDEVIVGRLFTTASKLAARLGVADDGYRMVMNCNEYAGQTVWHIHLHLLAGRRFHWPPG